MYKSIHKFTNLHTTLQNSTKTLQHFRRTCQNFTNLYKLLYKFSQNCSKTVQKIQNVQNYTTVYNTLQQTYKTSHTKQKYKTSHNLYKTLQNFTKTNFTKTKHKTSQHLTTLETTSHNYTQLFKTLQHSSKH